MPTPKETNHVDIRDNYAGKKVEPTGVQLSCSLDQPYDGFSVSVSTPSFVYTHSN